MKNPRAVRVCRLDDRQPGDGLLADALTGLSLSPKRLPSKYFYDARGSALFERICEQPEYYPTRTELAIMRKHVGEMAAVLGSDVRLVEYGSGSGLKTRLLLRNLESPVAYVPVEISRSALAESVAKLEREFPRIEMLPCARISPSRSSCRARRAHRGRPSCISPVRRLATSRRRMPCGCCARCAMKPGRAVVHWPAAY